MKMRKEPEKLNMARRRQGLEAGGKGLNDPHRQFCLPGIAHQQPRPAAQFHPQGWPAIGLRMDRAGHHRLHQTDAGNRPP
jgi:hypothetical protein